MFVERNNDAIVKDALHRHIHVDDFRKLGSEQGQKDALGCPAQIKIFLRRFADDGGQVNGIFSVGDSGEMKDRIIPVLRVITGVVAERPFQPHFRRVDVALQNNFCIGRNFQVHRLAFHQRYACLADKTGEKKLINTIRQGSGSGITRCRISTERNRDFHHLILFAVFMEKMRPVFMNMPVHGGSFFVVHLHAVESDIPDFFIHTAVDHDGEGDESSCVLRPALQDRDCS